VKNSSFFSGSNRGEGTRVASDDGNIRLTFLNFPDRKSSAIIISATFSGVSSLGSFGSVPRRRIYLFLMVSRIQ